MLSHACIILMGTFVSMKPSIFLKKEAIESDFAARYLKSLGHPGRLALLCNLLDGEKSVSELETLLDVRQASVSQMLARLRSDGLVKCRRSGKTVHYALADSTVARIVEILMEHFGNQQEHLLAG